MAANTDESTSSKFLSKRTKPQNYLPNKTNKPNTAPARDNIGIRSSITTTKHARQPKLTSSAITTAVWLTPGERGQTITFARSQARRGQPAKRNPRITTISTTRNNNSSTTCPRIGTASAASSASPPPTLSPVPLPPTATTATNLSASIANITNAARRTLQKPKLQEQNVAPLSAPILKENRKMGYDSLNPSTITTTNTTNRPQMPSLSGAAARGMNRPPLTPKIASASRPSQNQPKTPSLASATSLPKRTPQQQQSLRPSSTVNPNNTSPNRSLYDDPAISFAPHLSSNITPRSGSRQSRVDSANSTPNGTPNPERTEAWEAKANLAFSSPLNQGDSSKKPLVTFNAISPERMNSRDSKFFHASDIKTTARPTSASRTGPSKGPTFFYANGNDLTPKKTNSPATLSPPLSPGLTKTQDNVSSKFMYANGIPDLRPTAPPLRSHRSGSTVSTTSKGPTVATVPVARSPVASQRPASPSKLPLHSQLTHRYSANSTVPQSVPATRVQVTPPPLRPSPPALRRPGTATSRSSGHSRSSSLVQGEDPSESLRPLLSPMSGLSSPANLSPTKPAPLTLASIIQAAEEFGEHEADTPPDDQAVPQSPTKSTFSSSDPVAELVANARRERKVQDLQIRNASLEAINRTLERQLRKQTAELRRYRRLSRSGRLSLASTAASSRVTSGTLSELELESLGLSDLSEEASDMGDMEDEPLSDTDSASSDLSPSILAAQDAKHQQRDEERLNLDLAKHQQILIDSQKINQSIKRCLDWTEELIKDGKKALEYKVNVSDVKLGGRVLDPLDEEDETSKVVFNDETSALDDKPRGPMGHADMLPNPSTSWGTEAQDRDSGIELPGDGR